MRNASVGAISLGLTVLVVIGASASTTPGSLEAFIFEPYAFVYEVYADPELVLRDQGYDVLRLTDGACDLDPEETTLTSFESGLRYGYGVFCVSSHGVPEGFGVEAYPPDATGLARAKSAYWNYRSADWDTGEIYVALSEDGWHIAIRDSTVASSDKGFVSSQSLVYASPCSSWCHRWAWTEAREYLGYDYDILIRDSGPEAELFWDRMNGEHGKDMRCVAEAKTDLTIFHQGTGETVLAPTVLHYSPPTQTFGTWVTSVPCTVYFDCAMSQSASEDLIVADETFCDVDGVEWANDTTLTCAVRPTGMQGTGSLWIDAYCASSEGNCSPLDGNTDPEGTDGEGPNGDDFVFHYTFKHNPAASVEYFGVEDGQVVWRTTREDGTIAFRLLGSCTGAEEDWHLASEEIPSQGSPHEYRTAMPLGWAYLKLQEKEDRYRGPRWIDHEVCLTSPPELPNSKEPKVGGRPFLRVIGLEENVEAIEAFLGRMADASVEGDYEIVPAVTRAVLEDVFSPGGLEDTLRIIWPRPEGEGGDEGRSGDPADYWVGLVGLDTYEDALIAYKCALEDTSLSPWYYPIIHLIYEPVDEQDSVWVAEWIKDDRTGNYWILFGNVVHCNNVPETTMPCAYLKDPGKPVGEGCYVSLWDWECGISDPTRVRKCVGYVPVDDEDDLWNYVAKMIDYKWNNGWNEEYGSRLGAWTRDVDVYASGSGSYARSTMEAILGMADGHGWEVDSLWASAIPYGTGERADSAVAALLDGRSHVITLGSLAKTDDLCGFLESTVGYPNYVDLESALGDSRKYSQMLAMSCRLHHINSTAYDPIIEELLDVHLGGAVASVGPSGGFYQDYYYEYLKEFMELYHLGGNTTIGHIHRWIRNALLDENPDDPLMLLFCKTLPLLGDPTIKVGGPKWNFFGDVCSTEPKERHELSLGRPVPNPFNPTVEIPFSLPEAARVSLEIFNIRGQLVRTLVDGLMRTGEHHTTWDGKNGHGEAVGSGVYFCRLLCGGRGLTAKLVLLK